MEQVDIKNDYMVHTKSTEQKCIWRENPPITGTKLNQMFCYAFQYGRNSSVILLKEINFFVKDTFLKKCYIISK